jgi:hypothetical protein
MGLPPPKNLTFDSVGPVRGTFLKPGGGNEAEWPTMRRGAPLFRKIRIADTFSLH